MLASDNDLQHVSQSHYVSSAVKTNTRERKRDGESKGEIMWIPSLCVRIFTVWAVSVSSAFARAFVCSKNDEPSAGWPAVCFIPFLLVFLLLTGKWIWVHFRYFLRPSQSTMNPNSILCKSVYLTLEWFTSLLFSGLAFFFLCLTFSAKRIHSKMFILFRCCLE